MAAPTHPADSVPDDDPLRSAMALREWLGSASLMADLEKALPRHLRPEAFLIAVQNATRRDPDLALCTRSSLHRAVLELARLGLEPDGRRAWLTTEESKGHLRADYIIGYRGLHDLLIRTGQIAKCEAEVVHKEDLFEYEFGTQSFLRHRPARGDRGEITDFYCIVKFKDGREPKFVVMDAAEVWKIRDNSAGYRAAKRRNKPHAWDTSPAEMGKKTVFIRCTKLMELSPELHQVLDRETDTMPEHAVEERAHQTQAGPRGLFAKATTTTPAPEEGKEEESPEESAPTEAPESPEPAPPPPETGVPDERHARLVQDLRARLGNARVEFDEFFAWARRSNLVSPTAETTDDVVESDFEMILASWESVLAAFHGEE